MKFRQIRQPTNRHYSAWYKVGPLWYDVCCDCGLVHKSQFSVDVDEKKKQVTLWMRTRRVASRTREHRRKKK